MVSQLPIFRLPGEEEPLRTDDVFTTTCIIRDELQKLEDRCVHAQNKADELKQKRDEFSEILRLFQMIQENERNATQDLVLELDKLQKEHPNVPSGNMDNSRATCTSSLGGLTALLSEISATDTTQSSLSATPRLPQSSTASKGTTSATWRQKLASLVREPKDESYVSLSSAEGSDTTASTAKCEDSMESPVINTPKEGSRVLGVVTALKTNVANSLDMGAKWTKRGDAKPKYVGGGALRKTMPHKARRLSRKPFVPAVFTKSRFSVKRKAPPSPKGLDIGTPFDARHVSGTGTHLGEPTMEPLKGGGAFSPGFDSPALTLSLSCAMIPDLDA